VKSVEELTMFTAALMQRETYLDISDGTRHMRVAFTNVEGWRLPDEMCGGPGDSREQMVGSSEGADITCSDATLRPKPS